MRPQAVSLTHLWGNKVGEQFVVLKLTACAGQDGSVRPLASRPVPPETKAGSLSSMLSGQSADGPLWHWVCCCHCFWAKGSLSIVREQLFVFCPLFFWPLKISTAVWPATQPHFSIFSSPSFLPLYASYIYIATTWVAALYSGDNSNKIWTWWNIMK